MHHITESRLLRPTGSFSGGGGGGSSNNLLASASSSSLSSTSSSSSSVPGPPLPPTALPRALEEELEAQARASLSLFGFGVDSVNWSPAVAPPDGGNNSTGVSVRLMERVAPLGAHALLWRAEGGIGAPVGPSLSSNDDEVALEDDEGELEALAGGGSGQLQQFLVKSVAVLPSAALEEVVELLIRSDRADVDAAVQQLVGVKVAGSGFVYRRRRRRVAPTRGTNRPQHQPQAQNPGPRKRVPLAARRQHQQHQQQPPATVEAAKSGRQRRLADEADDDRTGEEEDDSSGSESDDDDADAVVVQDDLSALNVGLPLSSPVQAAPVHRSTRLQSADAVTTTPIRGYVHAHSWSSHPSPPMAPAEEEEAASAAYMSGYRRALARGGQQGNLSIKWAVGDKPARMFGARAAYCLLDFECELVDDWGPNSSSGRPMFVRTLRSCFLPQCQPWLDELGGRARNVQPAGVMVRAASGPSGSVELQLVASMLERAQLPSAARRAKLRALVARLGRVEAAVTGRRLSRSLLTTQPRWVRDRERPGCRACGARFGLSRRRHHCRICGEVCCNECCPKVELALPQVGAASVRVCVSCRHSQRRKSSEAPAKPATPLQAQLQAQFNAQAQPSPGREPLRRTTSTGSASAGQTPQRRPPPPPPPSTPTVMTPPVMTTPPHRHRPQLSLSPPSDPSLAVASALHRLKSNTSLT